jgi:hypothetical protein
MNIITLIYNKIIINASQHSLRNNLIAFLKEKKLNQCIHEVSC